MAGDRLGAAVGDCFGKAVRVGGDGAVLNDVRGGIAPGGEIGGGLRDDCEAGGAAEGEREIGMAGGRVCPATGGGGGRWLVGARSEGVFEIIGQAVAVGIGVGAAPSNW